MKRRASTQVGAEFKKPRKVDRQPSVVLVQQPQFRKNLGEMKYFDSERASATIDAVTTTWVANTLRDPSTPAGISCLFAPTVGAAINQRIGRQVNVYKIRIQGYVNVPGQSAANAADNSSCVRMLVVQDMQTNAAAMTSAQLLSDQTAADVTIHAYQNLSNFGRFRVLKDKKISISDMTLTGSPTAADVVQSGYKKNFKFNIKFNNPVSVRFNATNGGTVADIIDNSFHFIIGTDQVALAPLVSYVARVCYRE